MNIIVTGAWPTAQSRALFARAHSAATVAAVAVIDVLGLAAPPLWKPCWLGSSIMLVYSGFLVDCPVPGVVGNRLPSGDCHAGCVLNGPACAVFTRLVLSTPCTVFTRLVLSAPIVDGDPPPPYQSSCRFVVAMHTKNKQIVRNPFCVLNFRQSNYNSVRIKL